MEQPPLTKRIRYLGHYIFFEIEKDCWVPGGSSRKLTVKQVKSGALTSKVSIFHIAPAKEEDFP